jgi:O-antigen ligase
MQPQAAERFDRVIFVLIALVMLFAPLSIAATQISLGLAIAVWGIKMAMKRRWEVVATPIEPPLWTFVAVALTASVVSIQPLESFVRLKHLLLLSLLYLILGRVQNERRLHRLAFVLIGSASAASAWGLARFLSGDTMKVLATQSTTMTFGAMTVMTATLTASYLLFGQFRWGRILFALALGVQVAALSLSYVRGAYLGFAAGLFLLAALKRRRVVIYLLLGLVLLAFLLPRDVLDRLASIADVDKPSTQVRLYQWKTALLIFREHPLLGVGWIDLSELTRKFVHLGPEVPEAVRRDVIGIGHFHNMYLMVLVYFGSIGFLVFVWLLLRIAVKGYRTHRAIVRRHPDADALVCGSLAAYGGFLVAGMFDWTFGDAEVVTMMWIMVALVFAAFKATEAAERLEAAASRASALTEAGSGPRSGGSSR